MLWHLSRKGTLHHPFEPIWDVVQFSSVQSLNRVWLFETPWTVAHQASLSITSSRTLPKLTSIKSVMLSNHLILCLPILLLPSIFPSIRVFCNESVPVYWDFSFSWDVIVIQNHNQLLCYLEMFSPNGDICWLEVYGWSCLPSCSFFLWKELSTYLMPESQPEQEPGEKSGLS